MEWAIRLGAMALISISLAACAANKTPISEKTAMEIAERTLEKSRPELRIVSLRPGNNFVPAGPGSGGGPKWVVGFHTTNRKTDEKSIHYVTVFPDGRTGPSEVRRGPDMGAIAREP